MPVASHVNNFMQCAIKKTFCTFSWLVNQFLVAAMVRRHLKIVNFAVSEKVSVDTVSFATRRALYLSILPSELYFYFINPTFDLATRRKALHPLLFVNLDK